MPLPIRLTGFWLSVWLEGIEVWSLGVGSDVPLWLSLAERDIDMALLEKVREVELVSMTGKCDT